jgi:hypothetical protein
MLRLEAPATISLLEPNVMIAERATTIMPTKISTADIRIELGQSTIDPCMVNEQLVFPRTTGL